MFLKVQQSLSLNTDCIESFAFDHRMYANGPSDTTLIIMMIGGTQHRIKHEPHYLGGDNVYEIEKKIIAAAQASKDVALLQTRLDEIAIIAEGSETVNSLPLIAKIARGEGA